MTPKIFEQNAILEWSEEADYPVASLVKPLGGGGPLYYSKLASGPNTSAGPKDPTLSSNIEYWSVFSATGSIPVGTVIWYSSSTVPIGYLVCNGQAVSRTTYPDLFEAIGTTYGTGDGSTTFNLPNLIDKFAQGANSNVGDSVNAGLPNITGSLYQRSSTIDNLGGITRVSGAFYNVESRAAYENTAIVNATASTVKADRINFNASSSNSIYGNSSTVQPPAVKLLPCIKAYSDVDNLGSCDVAQLENYVQNNCVHLSGDEDIGGFKVFTYAWTLFNQVSISDLSGGSDIINPVNVNKNTYFIFRDKNNVEMSALQNHLNQSGNGLKLMVRQVGDGSTVLSNLSYVCLEAYSPSNVYSFHPSNNQMLLGNAGNSRWNQLYAMTTTIATSDERSKTSIDSFPDEVLDAWGSVNFVQYQFNNSVEEKGENARLHSGLIAQRIDEVFRSHGLDVGRYALFCHDEWNAEPEEIDESGNIVEQAKSAGDEYSLRYEEALCMEAAYQRRENRRLKEKVASLEERLANLESRLNIS